MRIAALWVRHTSSIDAIEAFKGRAVRVDHFTEPQALLLSWANEGFDAILVHDENAPLRGWLGTVQVGVLSRTPVIVVGDGDAASIALALMWGADDYATAAEGPAGLFRRVLARVRAREQTHPQPPLRVGAYSLHAQQRILTSPDHQVRLSSREFDLAQVLFEHRGQLVSVDALLAAIFDGSGARDHRSVERLVYTLRKKCEGVSQRQATPLRIDSVYGSGYRLLG